MRFGLLTMAALLAAPVPGRAQETSESQTATVEVQAAPATALPGERVTISGTTDVDAKTYGLIISVTNTATKATVQLGATADKEGRFSAVYDGTASTGRYEVVARSPSGRGSGTAFFTVAAPAVMVDDLSGEVQPDFAAAQEALAQVARMAPTLPGSPPKKELLQRLATAQERMAEFEQRLPVVSDALDKLASMLRQAPATARPLAKYTGQLRDWKASSESRRRGGKPDLTFGNTVCEQLERMNEGLNYASLLFDLVGDPISIVNNIFFDKYATDALSDVAGVSDDNAKFAIGQFLKVGLVSGLRALEQRKGEKIKLDGYGVHLPSKKNPALRGPARPGHTFQYREAVDLDGTVAGVLGDLTQFVVQKLFGASCERFTGSFSATLSAEFSKNLEPWWRYDERIEGVLDLRYPRVSRPGEPVAMTGEFQGVATGFTIWEDAIRVLFPKLAPATLTFRVAHLPSIGTPFHPAEMKIGKVGFALAFPKSFFIPVTAVYDQDRIVVHLQPATRDFKEHARVVYVFLSPLALLVPVVSSAELPYKDAHFILSHAGPQDGVFELPVTSSNGKLFVASSDFATRSGDGYNARGNYHIKIDVCNPGCP